MAIAGFTQHQFLTSLMFVQIPTAMFQHLVECFPGIVEAVLTALEGINADGFEIKCATSSYEYTVCSSVLIQYFCHVVHVN